MEFTKVIEKYSYSIGSVLYPNQVQALEGAFSYFKETEIFPEIKDPFVRLAFLMVIDDLMYTERNKAND